MTRFFAVAAIAVLFGVFGWLPALAQGSADPSAEPQCFPWQDLRNGRCVAKPATAPVPSAPPPAPAPPPALDRAANPPLERAANPCGRGLSLANPCKCPAASHLDEMSGTCVADAPPPPPPPPAVAPAPAPPAAVLCSGGTVTNGACACPAGFTLMSTDDNAANGGTCVKMHADNCLGGELTVSGTCLCTGQVVMSGETYGLEYANGKCVPKRCPEQMLFKGGRCVAISTTAAVPEPEPAKPLPPKETAGDDEHGKHCGAGMIQTHGGCVPARRRNGAAQGDLQRYYRRYQGSDF